MTLVAATARRAGRRTHAPLQRPSLDGETRALAVLAAAAVWLAAAAAAELLTPIQRLQDLPDGIGTAVAVSPDGRHLYRLGGESLAVFEREPAGGGLLEWVAAYVDGAGGVSGLAGARSVIVSADRRHVYVAGFAIFAFARDLSSGRLSLVQTLREGVGSVWSLGESPYGPPLYATDRSLAGGAVHALRRDLATGALTLVATYADGEGGVTGLRGANSTALSPDGRQLYVAADRSLAVFSRDPESGALDFLEAFSQDMEGLEALLGSTAVTASPDGRFVYTASSFPPPAARGTVFARDADSGRLNFVEEWSGGGFGATRAFTTSPDGGRFFMVSGLRLAIFARDAASGSVTLAEVAEGAPAFDGLWSVGSSPDGVHVYCAGGDKVEVFGRPGAGEATRLLAVWPQSAGAADGLYAATSIAFSSDGRHLYVGGAYDSSVAVYARDPAGGELAFVEIRSQGEDPFADPGQRRVLAVSPDGRHVYSAGGSFAGAGVGVFERNAESGGLRFLAAYGGEDDSVRFDAPLVIGSDGRHVVASGGERPLVLDRDPESGALSPAAVAETEPFEANSFALSPDGRHLYAGSDSSFWECGEVAVYAREEASGALTLVERLLDVCSPSFVLVSPDGGHVYVATGGTLAVLARDAATGRLSLVSQALTDGIAGWPGFIHSLATGPGGRELYAIADPDYPHLVYDDVVLAVLARDAASGRLEFMESHGIGDLLLADRFAGGALVAVDPAGAGVYAAGPRSATLDVFQRSCGPGTAALCLAGRRFRVEARWRDFRGATGPARVAAAAADDSGVLWFFDAGNWELLIKVLDGCAINGHYWVFLSATTDVGFTVTVTDTREQEVRVYSNPLGRAADAVTDTGAFATCP